MTTKKPIVQQKIHAFLVLHYYESVIQKNNAVEKPSKIKLSLTLNISEIYYLTLQINHIIILSYAEINVIVCTR